MSKRSPVVETKAVGPPQPDYLNAVAEIETDLTADALLGALLGIESAFGRVRTEPKGPRVLDLDLLLFGDLVLDSPHLTLPHPGLRSRRFVLEPLAAIAADLVPPGGRESVRELLANSR